VPERLSLSLSFSQFLTLQTNYAISARRQSISQGV
jgi:hypothetical protein